jgi:hypothetical protein
MKKRRKSKDSDNTGDSERAFQAAQRSMMIDAWKARDELYRGLFGKYSTVTPSTYGPPPSLSLDERTTPGPDKRWTDNLWKDTADPGDPDAESQHLAVLGYGPDPLRPYWTYVTAGLSTPWVQQSPEEVSGFGLELMIRTSLPAEWPATILRSMAFYVFNHAGTLSPGVRISLNGPIIAATQSQLRNLIVWYADEAPDCWYQLPSGGFGLFSVIGITDDELLFAESIGEYGTWCVQQLLRQAGHAQITDPHRQSVMTRPDSQEMIDSVKSFAYRFKEYSGAFDANDASA